MSVAEKIQKSRYPIQQSSEGGEKPVFDTPKAAAEKTDNT